jgi:hypothetical protein
LNDYRVFIRNRRPGGSGIKFSGFQVLKKKRTGNPDFYIHCIQRCSQVKESRESAGGWLNQKESQGNSLSRKE